MSEHESDFLAEIARKVADSDAETDAALADILAGRPHRRRSETPTPKPEKKPAPARKPRAKRPTARKS